ncbi:drug/metabolite transporter (DMT)-like permease [Kineococcus rhizosphaerae]|uniref:Drug/metabolite transporter (DMT)-like permease n=1 Tax=Kineococcus rhizosphaerae TaxID=559628 RepID=A0A2T0RBL8_9ACTN|nr:drug/metabolite transporter (DMT)-like permease [Kineococcus rhizosphaerae]
MLPGAPVSPAGRAGLGWGLLGVLAFSFTVVLTRVAVVGLSPLFIGAGRAVVAALLAAVALRLTRQRRPTRAQLVRLGVVAAGIVLGFPLLTSYALRTVPAAHGAVVIAVLPAATALAAVLRTGERPGRRFWGFAAAGAVAAVGFATTGPSGFGDVRGSDLLLVGAVVAAAVGYAEGGLLARELGAWQTVSWALVVALPVVLALSAVSAAAEPPHASAGQWLAFGYLAVVSMYLGFFAWYRGLAIGPMARVSQVQLVQPVLTIAWALLFLREPLSWSVVVGALVVVGCAALTVRNRSGQNQNQNRNPEENR